MTQEAELSNGTKPIRGIEAVKEAYRKLAKKSLILLVGPNGSGKTRMTGYTMPGPGFTHSFDPGGTETYQELIDAGKITVDTQFERTTGEKTTSQTLDTSWDRYEKEFKKLYKAGTFDDLAEQGGWYCIDSFSGMLDCIMDHSQHKDLGRKKDTVGPSRRGDVPIRNDYHAQQVIALSTIRDLCTLPCNLIITAHLSFVENDSGQAILAAVLGPKGVKEKAPLYFSEVWYMETKPRSTGTIYNVLTCNEGIYKGKTRMGREGLFKAREPADFTYLLNKAGKLGKETQWLSKDFERIKEEQRVIELKSTKK